METPQKSDKAPLGATIPDVLLCILSSPYLAAPLLLFAVALLVSVGLGFVEVSWADGGVKISQGERNESPGDLNINGRWEGLGKDLNDSEGNLKPKFTYTMTFDFEQKGARVKMHATYRINEDKNLPERTITGEGVLHDGYLTTLIDIQAGNPVIAKTHGTMIFRFQPTASTARGYYTNRSMQNDDFVFGSLALSR